MNAPFKLNHFMIEPQTNRIHHEGQVIQLEPRLMKLLVFLCNHYNDVLSRDRIVDEIWGDTVVVDSALSQAISELRRILGDSSKNPQYIETIRKGGYRFIAQISPQCEVQSQNQNRNQSQTAFKAEGEEQAPWVIKSPLSAISGVITLILLVMAGFVWLDKPNQDIRVLQPIVEPVTSSEFFESKPALSPNGQWIAYQRQVDSVQQVFIQQKGSLQARQLTSGTLAHTSPAWSKDGTKLAYIHQQPQSAVIKTNTTLGGDESTLFISPGRVMGLSWHQDNQRLFYAAVEQQDQTSAVYVWDRRNLKSKQLTQPKVSIGRYGGDRHPKVSIDGTKVAFIRRLSYGKDQLGIINLKTDTTDLILNKQQSVPISGMDWYQNNNQLVYSATYQRSRNLWLFNIEDRKKQWFYGVDQFTTYPAVAYDTDELIFEQSVINTDVYIVSQDDNRQLTHTSSEERDSALSSEGKSVVFSSWRSGFLELWISNTDGSQMKQLTKSAGKYRHISSPHFSPDNSKVAFSAMLENQLKLFIVNLKQGLVEPLTSDNVGGIASGWSEDGKWLYYTREVDAQWQMWRYNLTFGMAERLIPKMAKFGQVHRNGDLLFYTTISEPVIHQYDVQSKSDTLIVNDMAKGDYGNWAIAGDHLYYVKRSFNKDKQEIAKLMRLNVLTAKLDTLQDLPDIVYKKGLSVSRDGRWVSYIRRGNEQSNLYRLHFQND